MLRAVRTLWFHQLDNIERTLYLHSSPASRRRRWKRNPMPGDITGPPPFLVDINTGTWSSRLRESRIWDSKMWSWVPRDSNPRMTALAKSTAIVNDRPILSSERMLHKDYDRKRWVENKTLVVCLKRLVDKTNWLAVNRQSYSNSDSDSDSDSDSESILRCMAENSF
jgi:hypothetical protein